MGKVYLAQHVHTGRIAVLKSLLPQYAQNEKVVQRFYQEGKVLAQLSHPAIVQLYDFFVEQQSQVDINKKRLSVPNCSVISYQWRVERREPCE